jgi:CubicO group peptidase (beta-lactamase class C family)
MLVAMKHATWLWTLLVVACGASPGGPAKPSDAWVAASLIAHIEHGLLPAVQVKGEDVRHSLEARMREHKIPAISIAVFENYQLQWAKAYGIADVDTGARATEDTTFLAGSISKSVGALEAALRGGPRTARAPSARDGAQQLRAGARAGAPQARRRRP